MTSKLGVLASAVALALTMAAPVVAQAESACTWTTTDLPVPAGSYVYGVDSASSDGEWAATGSWGHSTVVWHGNEARLVRFTESTIVKGVSAAGTLAANTDTEAFRRSASGVRERLLPLPGTTGRTWADSINSSGEVAGKSGGYLVVWPADSATPRRLPDPDNRRGWVVRDIDDEGRVIARTVIGGGDYVGYLWDRDGNRVQLEMLPGDRSVDPVAVRGGRVVGSSGPNSNVLGTVVEWGADGRIVRSLPSVSWYAMDINARGDVLGVTGDRPVVIVRPTGETEAVDGLAWGQQIADDGEVLGVLSDPNGGVVTPRRATCQQA